MTSTPISRLLYFALFAVLVSACGLFKSVDQDPDRDDDPDVIEGSGGRESGNSGPGTMPDDTVEVVTTPGKIDSPDLPDVPGGYDSTNTKDPDPVLMSQYNVAIMMPFYADQGVTRRGEPTLDFYAGVRMALEQLEGERVSLRVTVHDTKGSEATTEQLLQSYDVQRAQLIVGPVATGAVQKVAEYAKQNDKLLVSPFNPREDITADNPNYIQVSPYLQTHAEVIVRDIRRRFKPEQVVIVAQDKADERERIAYYQDANTRIAGTDGRPVTARFKEYIKTDGLDIKPYLRARDTTVIIVPSFAREQYIMSVLRAIKLQAGNRPVVVYGMPRWQSYERIDYKLYEDLSVHITAPAFIDRSDAAVRTFADQYVTRYSKAPSLNAYVGYDTMLYFGRMLRDHGSNFAPALDDASAAYLHTKFAFQPNYAPGSENFYTPIQYENKYVNLLRFRDYYFQVINR